MSPNIVHCAVADPNEFDITDHQCFIPDIRLYADAMPNVINILSYYNENIKYPWNYLNNPTTKFIDDNYYRKKGLCISHQLYYTRTPMYLPDPDDN